MRAWYLESSALVAWTLEQDREVRRELAAAGRLVTSSLTFAETRRAILRARRADRIGTEEERVCLLGVAVVERRSHVLPVSGEVLERAGRPFAREPVRTLDAIHLASVELLGEPPQLVTVITRDRRIAENARALGYAVA